MSYQNDQYCNRISEHWIPDKRYIFKDSNENNVNVNLRQI